MLPARPWKNILAYEANDHAATERMRPPRQLQAMIQAAGVTETAYFANSRSRIEDAYRLMAIAPPRLLSDGLAIHQTSGGQAYAIATTETFQRELVGGLLRTQRPLMALEDAGIWYVTRIADPMDVMFLRTAYPEFTDVRFPTEHSELITKSDLPADLQESEQ